MLIFVDKEDMFIYKN